MLLEHVASYLNRCIDESTRAREYRERLRGRSLGIAIVGTPFDMTLEVDGDALRIARGVDPDADVRIETGPGGALKLLEADSVAALRRADAKIHGDLHVADAYGELLRHAKPDIEEVLSRWIGDVPAHALAELARSTAQWSGDLERACERNVAEYLKAEIHLLPHPLEVARFGRDVERTRDDVARMEQRLERIARRLAQRAR